MSSTDTRGRLPVPKRDRRPFLAMLAILLILLGAFGSALIAFRTGDRINVVQVSQDVDFGDQITPNDLQAVRAAADTPGVVPWTEAQGYVGRYATTRIPGGSLLSSQMASAELPIPDQSAVVGLTLDPSRRPTYLPHPGQVVRVVYVAGAQGGSGQELGEEILAGAALVVGVSGGRDSDTASVSVLVDQARAWQLMNHASSGNVAIALLPDGTPPNPAPESGAAAGEAAE